VEWFIELRIQVGDPAHLPQDDVEPVGGSVIIPSTPAASSLTMSSGSLTV
jgi:hypothetical protein